MCTSDAPRSTALVIIWFTSRMTGASLAISRSRSTSNSLPSLLASATLSVSSPCASAAGVLIQRPQGAFDFCRSNHGEIDAHIEHIADCLCSLVDEGIGGCDQQAPAVERNRQDPIGLEKGELQSISQNGLFRDICGVDHRKTAIGGVGNAKIAFGNETEL